MLSPRNNAPVARPTDHSRSHRFQPYHARNARPPPFDRDLLRRKTTPKGGYQISFWAGLAWHPPNWEMLSVRRQLFAPPESPAVETNGLGNSPKKADSPAPPGPHTLGLDISDGQGLQESNDGRQSENAGLPQGSRGVSH